MSFSLVTFEYFLMIVVSICEFCVAVAPFYGTSQVLQDSVKIGFSVMVAILSVFRLFQRDLQLDYEGVCWILPLSLSGRELQDCSLDLRQVFVIPLFY